MTTRNMFVAFGLILIGILLFLDRIGVFDFSSFSIFWMVVFIAGASIFLNSVIHGQPGKMFWGTFLSLVSLYFILRRWIFQDTMNHTFIPAVLLAFGFSFLTVYAFQPKQFARLVLGIVFVVSAGLWMAAWVGFADAESIFWFVARFWPVILIILGLSLLFRKKNGAADGQNQVPNQTGS